MCTYIRRTRFFHQPVTGGTILAEDCGGIVALVWVIDSRHQHGNTGSVGTKHTRTGEERKRARKAMQKNNGNIKHDNTTLLYFCSMPSAELVDEKRREQPLHQHPHPRGRTEPRARETAAVVGLNYGPESACCPKTKALETTHVLQEPEDKRDGLGHNLLDPCPTPPSSPEARHDDANCGPHTLSPGCAALPPAQKSNPQISCKTQGELPITKSLLPRQFF